jgi:hypothetical protein
MNKRHKDEETAHPSWGTLKGETVSKEQGICKIVFVGVDFSSFVC